jgi:hypothetical protein
VTIALSKAKTVGTNTIAAISEAELAIRLCEANYGLRRPAGLTAEQALDAMEPECRDGWRASARAAMEYWRECVQGMRQTS